MLTAKKVYLGTAMAPPFAYEGAGLVAETVKVMETVKVADTATRA